MAERHAARVQARIMGSSVSHVFLIIRDIYVYRSFNPFTPQAMMNKKRKKMTQKGKAPPTDDEVCHEIIGSSTKSNEGWNKIADDNPLGDAEKALQGALYVYQTMRMYIQLTPVIVAIAYLSEVLARRRSASSKKDA